MQLSTKSLFPNSEFTHVNGNIRVSALKLEVPGVHGRIKSILLTRRDGAWVGGMEIATE